MSSSGAGAGVPGLDWKWALGLFVAVQVGVMLLAISGESLWIDEFWSAHFATVGSLKAFFELLLVPSGSQTPLHFLHYHLWNRLVEPGEFLLRLANLPLFVAGQLALFLALRSYPAKFGILLLALCAIHPMVWQYANEARQYVMTYAGSQMILACLLRMHAVAGREGRVDALFTAIFVAGSILVLGASLLGIFWVFAAVVYIGYFHCRRLNWRDLTRGASLILGSVLALAGVVLVAYYLRSLLAGAGASRLSSSTPATVLFAFYELMGLAGIGPGRLELRAAGPGALGPFAAGLVPAAGLALLAWAMGLRAAARQVGTRELAAICALVLFPVVAVLASGFVMHWRVLGRHLIATLPMLNLLLAIGLLELLRAREGGRGWRPAAAGLMLLLLLYSSLSLRFADRHRKDDYRSAAAIALQGVAKGQRVWWAADAIGANYYGLPGEFDFMGELTGVHQPIDCVDRPGVRAVSNLSGACLGQLAAPDLVILSKPETFDTGGAIAAYLEAGGFAQVQALPAFTIWRPAGRAGLPAP